jgi:Ser/Thr protein kinase RdoA (MazF antagonist)
MEYNKLAEDILSSYLISNPEIIFIRHNENITFKITDKLNDKSYLLRIHTPITEGFTGTQNTLEGLTSEMILLNELNRDNVLCIQEPIVNQSGNYVTVYRSSDTPSPYFATLLVWIEGVTLTLEEENIEEIVFELGKNLAILHEITRHSKPIKNLIRPVYDVNRIDYAITELRYGVEIGLYSEEQYKTIKEVLALVKRQIRDLDLRELAWGLIHADLQLGNIIHLYYG